MFSEIGCPKGWTETYCEDAAARSVMTPNVILVFYFIFFYIMQSFAESLPRSNKLVLAEMKLLGKVMHSSKCTQMLKQSRVSSFANGSVKLSTFRRRP